MEYVAGRNLRTLLEEAHRLLEHVRRHAPAEFRDSMAHVPLHRDIVEAWGR